MAVEIPAYKPRVLGRNPEPAALLAKLQGQVGQVRQAGHVQPPVGDGDDQVRRAIAQVLEQHQAIAALPTVLEKPVEAGDAEIGATVVNLRGNV